MLTESHRGDFQNFQRSPAHVVGKTTLDRPETPPYLDPRPQKGFDLPSFLSPEAREVFDPPPTACPTTARDGDHDLASRRSRDHVRRTCLSQGGYAGPSKNR